MPTEDADIALPIVAILALVVGIGVYHKVTAEPRELAPREIEALLDKPADAAPAQLHRHALDRHAQAVRAD